MHDRPLPLLSVHMTRQELSDSCSQMVSVFDFIILSIVGACKPVKSETNSELLAQDNAPSCGEGGMAC